MSDVDFVKYVKGFLGGDYRETNKNLRKNKFRSIGSGCFKRVYVSPLRRDLVVKIYFDDETIQQSCFADWKDDSYFSLPKTLSDYWLKPIARFRRGFIQPRVKVDSEAFFDLQDALLGFNLDAFDIHDGNCGYHNGKPIFFDYLSQ